MTRKRRWASGCSNGLRRNRGGLRHAGLAAGRQFQQRLGRLRRQVVGQDQQRVLGRLLDVAEPLRRHAVAEQFVVGLVGEQRRFLRGRRRRQGQFRLHIDRDDDLLDGLADFDQLRGARFGMRLQLAAFRPVIGLVVVIDVAEQKAGGRLVNDQPDVAAHPHRPEVLVLCLVELVEAHAGIGRVELQVERRRLDGLLLVAGQSGEAVGEGVGDAEFHSNTCAIRYVHRARQNETSRGCIRGTRYSKSFSQSRTAICIRVSRRSYSQ